ncbi:YbfB/YjiJ family MFS transporter [Nocardia sp. CA-084685]|uniref:YbfB/YjiJ family MFS transporter n=1 Tax=Nocardia sp. CA-084685 TaxID=3239970 RepID=UPI003D964C3C
MNDQLISERVPSARISPLRGRRVSVAAAAGLAAAMGVGRFVFTPLLPIMTASAGLSAGDGAVIATGNYAGYLAGALLLTRMPHLSRRSTFLVWSVVLIASEAAMATTAQVAAQTGLRCVAGAASAAIFIACAATVAHHRDEGASLGVAFAGVGAGIATTGVYTLLAAPHLTWQGLWLGSALLTALLLVPAWLLDIRGEKGNTDTELGIDSDAALAESRAETAPAVRRVWRFLLACYFVEGVGYIIVGTFLVAAVAGHRGSSVAGAVVWTIVGLAAVPATVGWHAIARRISTGPALTAALMVQAVGTASAAISGSLAAAVVAALAFGATFMGAVVLAIDFGHQLSVTRAAASLTAVYAVGQVIGPLIVVPVIGDSFATAFTLAAVIIAVAATLALAATLLHHNSGRGDHHRASAPSIRGGRDRRGNRHDGDHA